jgi:hypothetical protein
MPSTIQILDYWTQIALNAIWKENIQESIQNNTTTGSTKTDEWYLVEHTPFTEPIWGKVVNR